MTETPTLDLAELERLEKAATEAPWFVHDFSGPEVAPSPVAADVTISCDHPATITVANMGGGLSGFKGIPQAQFDAAFITALRNAAPDLIAAAKERDELRAERDEAIADARQIAMTNLHADAAWRGARDAAEMLRAELASLRADNDQAWGEVAALEATLLKQAANLITYRALLVRAGEAFGVIHRRLAPGTLTFDELIRETGFVDDLARALLAAIAAEISAARTQEAQTRAESREATPALLEADAATRTASIPAPTREGE